MKKVYLLFLLFTLLAGCRTNRMAESLPFNPFVEAFTAGKVSRHAPIYLVFNQEIDPQKMAAAEPGKRMKMQPEIPGEWSFENGRTVVFRPRDGFQRNTAYSVTADLSAWFDTEEKDRRFTFSFSTLPLAVRANLESLDVADTDELAYDLHFVVLTPDREGAGVLESLIGLSHKADTAWKHDPDGKKHELTVRGLAPGKKEAYTFTVSTVSNKLKVARETLVAVKVPAEDQFSVFDVQYKREPERCIEVTFTRPLDEKQQMEGLARIGTSGASLIRVDGNKLRLYPDADQTDKLQVQLYPEIRSRDGQQLETLVTREIQTDIDHPAVRFTGKGTIVPQSTQLTVPFQSIYLRGVIVRVIRIGEHNIGQFLQNNHLDGSNELVRVGRIVARKTIFLDEEDADLSRWNTFAVDLRELIEPEPGAIYRVELSFNQDLSAYPCEGVVQKSKQQILADDEIKFREELSRFDRGSYYYYDDEFNWYEYDYDENENPCSYSFYNYTNIGRNVLATNLGLMAKGGADGTLTVMVHDLITTEPLQGVTIAVHNYQHRELTSGTTDDKGKAVIELGDSRAFYVVASHGRQKSYLRIDGGSALSLSSFDVSGEQVQKGLKGFIYGERGVWRPGDTIHLSFMLNDRNQTLPKDHPVVLELYNPLGQLYARKTQAGGVMGLYAFQMTTEADAPTGAWNVRVKVGGVTFSKRIRVETIKPNRLKIDLKMPDKTLLQNAPLNAPLHVEWMQGATARNLAYEIDGSFVSIPTTFPNYSGFVFDDPSKTFRSEESRIESGRTDEKGDAVIDARFETGYSSPGMLMANLVIRVFEESGEFSIDADRVQYSPYERYVGIKSPQQGRTRLETGKQHAFEIASVDYKGHPQQNTRLDIQIYKMYWYWWWSSDNDRLANYISSSYNKPVKQGTIYTAANGIASLKLSFPEDEWGTYFIHIKDRQSNHSTGIMAYFDWPYAGRRNREGSDAANLLTFKTDKDTYAPGEKMTVTFPSPEGSRAIITIENGSRVIAVSEHECTDGETTVQLDVTSEMLPNAYLYITLLQPHANTVNDLPIRLYGVVPFKVDSPETHLEPVIRMADEIKPEQSYEVTVSEQNGRPMAYTLAIVDEGLLDLTRFPTPDPWSVFNAREALGISSWDLYNYVMGAYGGRIEQIFSIGGDDALNNGPKAVVNRFKPVVEFAGPFQLKKGEKKKHTFQMPNYNGRVRVMVIAGDGKAYGHTDKSVMVRKPVMLLGTLPRIIGINEEMTVPATIFATEDGVGAVKVTISCSDNMQIVGPSTRELHFTEKTDKQALFRIRTKGLPGAGKVTITAVGKGDKSVYQTDIEIRSVRRKQTKVQSLALQPGENWKQTLGLPGSAGTNSLALEVSDVQPLNLASRLKFLIGYPHGCIEQITSKGFPQLYLKQFAALTSVQQKTIEGAVKEVISRQRSYQTSEGGFSYWPGGSAPHSWGSVFATHFQLEAEAHGYLVPEGMKRNALNYLKQVARNWDGDDNSPYNLSEQTTQAYRLYVLALGGNAETGAMNRLREYKNLLPVSRWLLAAAYARTGRNDVATELIHRTKEITSKYDEYDETFGSDVRDKGIQLLTYCLVNDGKAAAELVRDLSSVLSSERWLSTQSTAWALMAVSEYMTRFRVAETMDFSYKLGANAQKVTTDKSIWTQTLLEGADQTAALELTNTGKSTLFVRIIGEGVPDQGNEVATENGISLLVSYTDPSGRPLDVSDLRQGDHVTALVTVRNPSSRLRRNLVLTQVFPAGWEILNTRFMNDDTGDDMPAGVSYQDFRDDRVYSYMDLMPGGRQVTVRIDLIAAYSGTFYLPPVFCEAMYDNSISANSEGRMVKVE